MTKLLAPAVKAEIDVKDILRTTIEKFLASLDTKELTKEAYKKALRVFQIWVTDKGYHTPTRENILEYKQYLQEKTVVGSDGIPKHVSSLTVTAYLTALRRFFAFLEGEKIYPNVAKDKG
jgi:integrase/recombinase XerC/integrase/recombinase XerD